MAGNPKPEQKADIGALWNAPDDDGGNNKLEGGKFVLDLAKKPVAVAIAAPGLQ